MFSNSERLSIPTIINALSIAALFLVFYFLVGFFTANAFHKIAIKGIFPESSSVKIFFAKDTHGYSDQLFFEAPIVGQETEQLILVPLSNRIIHKLKLDFPVKDRPIVLQQIVLHGFFQSKPAVVSFEKDKQARSVRQGRMLMPGDANFEIKSIQANKHVFVHIILPFTLALGCWFWFRAFDWRKFPAIQDVMSNQRARNTDNLQALDGLRGIAALTVLMEHTMFQFVGLGRAGVWLFFALSGFLLTRSFVLNPRIIFTAFGIRNYFVKRMKLLVPRFYLMGTVIFLLQGKIGAAMRHYFFVQGDGHFWTILNELYFYIFLPLIAFLCYFLFKQRHLFSMMFLVVLAVAWYYLCSEDWVSIYGLGAQHAPYFYVFLLGMAIGYFYYGIFRSSEGLQNFCNNWSQAIGISMLFSMLAFFIYSSKLGDVNAPLLALNFPLLSAVIAAMLILSSAIISEKSIYNRILSLSILRLVGIVGYSFYLIHPYAIAIFRATFEFMFVASMNDVLPNIFIMIGSLLVTMPIAMFTYSYIERPFLRNDVKKSRM
jgi:peptidoglycan/LPS O-acetylase OafA/YrhL